MDSAKRTADIVADMIGWAWIFLAIGVAFGHEAHQVTVVIGFLLAGINILSNE